MAEFGRAATMAKQLRHQLNNLLFYFADRTLGNRLTSLVHRIQKADQDNPRGERVFTQANSGMLRGFEFNTAARLGGLFAGELPVDYDRASGDAMLEIPAFNAQSTLTLLQGATHVQFVFAGAALDLEAEFPEHPSVSRSDFIPMIGEFAGETLTVHIEADEDQAVYLLAGIGVYQEVNGQYYPLNNGQHNALTIVEVSQ